MSFIYQIAWKSAVSLFFESSEDKMKRDIASIQNHISSIHEDIQEICIDLKKKNNRVSLLYIREEGRQKQEEDSIDICSICQQPIYKDEEDVALIPEKECSDTYRLIHNRCK